MSRDRIYFAEVCAMTTQPVSAGSPNGIFLVLRAIVLGVLIALVAANVWPLLLLNVGAVPASLAELLFLAGYVWWASGGGPPRSLQTARAVAFRRDDASRRPWGWTLMSAFFFAITVHASIVLLFRLMPFPAAAFRQGYDFSFIPSASLRWLAVFFSALSAGVCEETGFRGYMQRPIEQRYGAPLAIAISSVFFTAIHLTKGWALAGMVPIVLGAGVLLGVLAWSAGSLVPAMIGHVLMDIGLFAYWWTGIAGTFSGRPIRETGLDAAFFVTCTVVLGSLGLLLLAVSKLRKRRTGAVLQAATAKA